MSRHKIAVIGLGKISEDQHLPILAASDRFELAAVVSQRGHSFQGLPTFRTPAELFDARPDIGTVAVNTPPTSRHGIARAALLAGKDVLLEKPPAATLAELADLEALAAEQGRVLFATWHSQLNPAVDATRDLLATAGLRSLKIEWREDVRKWHPGQDWVWQPGGFGVFDPGINALSILVKILPMAVFLRQAELTFPANRDTPIAASLQFGAADPALALSAEFDWREQGGETWHMLIELADGQSARLAKGGVLLERPGLPPVEAPAEEYQRIYQHFAELLEARRSDLDGRPLRLVADAMLIGRRLTTDAFDW